MDSRLQQIIRQMKSEPDNESLKQAFLSTLTRMGENAQSFMTPEILLSLFAMQPYFDHPLFESHRKYEITKENHKDIREEFVYLYGQYTLSFPVYEGSLPENTRQTRRSHLIPSFQIEDRFNDIVEPQFVTTDRVFFKTKGSRTTLNLGPSFYKLSLFFDNATTNAIKVRLYRERDFDYAY